MEKLELSLQTATPGSLGDKNDHQVLKVASRSSFFKKNYPPQKLQEDCYPPPRAAPSSVTTCTAGSASGWGGTRGSLCLLHDNILRGCQRNLQALTLHEKVFGFCFISPGGRVMWWSGSIAHASLISGSVIVPFMHSPRHLMFRIRCKTC